MLVPAYCIGLSLTAAPLQPLGIEGGWAVANLATVSGWCIAPCSLPQYCCWYTNPKCSYWAPLVGLSPHTYGLHAVAGPCASLPPPSPPLRVQRTSGPHAWPASCASTRLEVSGLAGGRAGRAGQHTQAPPAAARALPAACAPFLNTTHTLLLLPLAAASQMWRSSSLTWSVMWLSGRGRGVTLRSLAPLAPCAPQRATVPGTTRAAPRWTCTCPLEQMGGWLGDCVAEWVDG